MYMGASEGILYVGAASVHVLMYACLYIYVFMCAIVYLVAYMYVRVPNTCGVMCSCVSECMCDVLGGY